MKKLILFLLILSNCITAQENKNPNEKKEKSGNKNTDTEYRCFKKGAIITGADFGLGMYQVSAKDAKTGKTDANPGVSGIFSLNGEYGITDKIGIGMRLHNERFVAERDTTNKTKPEARSATLSLQGNYHLVRKRKLDLLTGTAIGFTGFNYRAMNAENSKADAKMLFFDLNAALRIYFTPRFGMFGTAAYTLHYSKKLFAQSDVVKREVISDFMVSGMQLRFGMVLRLGKLE